MSLTLELALTKSALADQANPTTNKSGQSSYDLNDSNGDKLLFMAFQPFPDNLKAKKIVAVYLSIQFLRTPMIARQYPSWVYLYDVLTDFTENTLTWNNKPTYKPDESTSIHDSGVFKIPLSTGLDSKEAKRLTYPAFCIDVSYYDNDKAVIADMSTAKLVVVYDPDVTVGISVSAQSQPSYVSPYSARTFAWNITPSGGYSYNSALGITQASAVFYWRMGTSGPYTAVNVSGSTQSVTIPANTFSAGTVQYYVTVTDTKGNTATSAVRSVTTSDAAISATPIAPVNSIEDAGDVIVFRWSINSPNGTAPTGADLEGSSNGSTWVSFGTVSGAANSFAAPANTFTAGTRYWRVRIYNADSVAGSWSAAASFVSVGAPAAPAVSINAVPFATISWDAEGQQAYRITVDGEISGPFFGTGKSFTLPDYLADGEHTVSVEVQGQYGLWSQPGTVSFPVANLPGDAVTLQGSFGVDAMLEWSTPSATADFLIYRDGVKIGHTVSFSFADRLALGEHSYQVLNRLPDGNYTLSNAVSGVLQSEITRVALFPGGAWLQLPLSERSSSEQRFDYSRSYSLRHMMGAALPVLELSPYEDGSGTYEAAFRDAAEAQAFAQLRGKLVIIKSRRGELLVGALTRVATRQTNFYTAVEFVVQRCHYEDYVDDENS